MKDFPFCLLSSHRFHFISFQTLFKILGKPLRVTFIYNDAEFTHGKTNKQKKQGNIQSRKSVKTITDRQWTVIHYILKCPRGVRVFSFRSHCKSFHEFAAPTLKASFQVQSWHEVPEEPDSHWSRLEVDQSSSVTEMWCMMVVFQSGFYRYTDTSDYCVSQSEKVSRPYHRGHSGEYCSRHQ